MRCSWPASAGVWGSARIPWEERYARLALIPEGAQVLDPGGMACGFALKHGGARLFFLPGVPEEMRVLFDALVLPALVESAGGGERLAQRTLRLFGISEAQLQQVVSHLPDFQHRGVTVGFYPNFPETHLTLTMRGPDRQALEETLDRLTSALAREVGDVLLGSGPGLPGRPGGALSQEKRPHPGGGGILYRRPHRAPPHRRARRLGLFPGRGGELQQRR